MTIQEKLAYIEEAESFNNDSVDRYIVGRGKIHYRWDKRYQRKLRLKKVVKFIMSNGIEIAALTLSCMIGMVIAPILMCLIFGA